MKSTLLWCQDCHLVLVKLVLQLFNLMLNLLAVCSKDVLFSMESAHKLYFCFGDCVAAWCVYIHIWWVWGFVCIGACMCVCLTLFVEQHAYIRTCLKTTACVITIKNRWGYKHITVWLQMVRFWDPPWYSQYQCPVEFIKLSAVNLQVFHLSTKVKCQMF